MFELFQKQETSIYQEHAKLKLESNLNSTADVYSVLEQKFKKKKKETPKQTREH